MIPAVTIAPPTPVALANTTLPGSIAIRPPYNNVTPPVSSAGVDNNASSNNTIVNLNVADETSAATGAPFPAFASGASADGIASAQTNFFAQLIGQGGGDDAHAFLAVYEHLMQIGQVRYKPSDAGVPEPEPSSVFGKIVQQEKAAPHDVARAAPQVTQTTAQVTSEVASTGAGLPQLPKVERTQRSSDIIIRVTRSDATDDTSSDIAARSLTYIAVPAAPQTPPKASSAYGAAITRSNLADVRQQTIESA